MTQPTPPSTPQTPATAAQQRFWPPHKPRTLTLPRTGLMHALRVSADRYPDRVALWHYGNAVTYRQLVEDAEHLAGHFAAQGVGHLEDVVGAFFETADDEVCARLRREAQSRGLVEATV